MGMVLSPTSRTASLIPSLVFTGVSSSFGSGSGLEAHASSVPFPDNRRVAPGPEAWAYSNYQGRSRCRLNDHLHESTRDPAKKA